MDNHQREIPGSMNKKIPPAGATSNWGPSPGPSGHQAVYCTFIYKDQLLGVVVLSDFNLEFGTVLLHAFARNKAVLLEYEAPSA